VRSPLCCSSKGNVAPWNRALTAATAALSLCACAERYESYQKRHYDGLELGTMARNNGKRELGVARHHAYDDGIAAIIFIVQAENVEKCVMAVVPGDAGECLAERSG